MPTLHSVLFAVLASSAIVHADFYIIRASVSNPPNCAAPETGCIVEPATMSTDVIGIDDLGNCDALGKLKGADINGWVDHIYPAKGKQGGQPFSTSVAEGNNVCGLTDQMFWFRVQAQNPGQLDAATDSDFNHIVANCYKQPNCGDFGAKSCSTPADYTAVYRCGPLNGSGC